MAGAAYRGIGIPAYIEGARSGRRPWSLRDPTPSPTSRCGSVCACRALHRRLDPAVGLVADGLRRFALLDRLLADTTAKQRFRRMWLTGAWWLGPAMLWMMRSHATRLRDRRSALLGVLRGRRSAHASRSSVDDGSFPAPSPLPKWLAGTGRSAACPSPMSPSAKSTHPSARPLACSALCSSSCWSS